MQGFCISCLADTARVDQVFQNSPELVGVMVQKMDRSLGVISRRKFYELLGKPFGVAIFFHRPIEIMLEQIEAQPLVVSSSLLIGETVRMALGRSIDQIYEPLLVHNPAGEYQLLDIYTLLLAQANLFAALRQQVQEVNVELEKRVQARTGELVKEVSVRRHAEAMLEFQLRYEKTLNECAKALLTEAEKHETIQETISLLIEAVGVSRVFFLEHLEVEGVGRCLKLRNQVNAGETLPIPEEKSIFEEKVWEKWFTELWKGNPVMGQREDMEPTISQRLEDMEIASLLLIPIGEPGNWLGAIGFGDTHSKRAWGENVIQLLFTIAPMLYAYMQRQRNVLMLAQARDEALQASQFKSELLAKVSHELRTPLAAVLGYSQLLQIGSYGQLSDEQKDVAEVVISSTKYLSTLVNGILDQAQIESGQLVLTRQVFPIRQVAADVEARTRVLAESKGLKYEVVFDELVPETMTGDAMRLGQVLINLLGNAIKFTDAGKVGMYFSARQTDRLVVEIADTGTGIPAEAQERIFEPFTQVDGSVTRRYSGTGLGLSISRQLVLMMQGTIRLKSEMGVGSAFKVDIPLEPV